MAYLQLLSLLPSQDQYQQVPLLLAFQVSALPPQSVYLLASLASALHLLQAYLLAFLALVLLLLLGLAFFVPVLFRYFKTGTVGKIPTLIVSCLVMLAAMISWFSGIILSTIRSQNRQQFEDQLLRAEHWKRQAEKEA